MDLSSSQFCQDTGYFVVECKILASAEYQFLSSSHHPHDESRAGKEKGVEGLTDHKDN
jgi:hypothetical protein